MKSPLVRLRHIVVLLLVLVGAAVFQVLRTWSSLSTPPFVLPALSAPGPKTAEQVPLAAQVPRPATGAPASVVQDVPDAIRTKIGYLELRNVCWSTHPTSAHTKGGGLVQVFTDNASVMDLVLSSRPEQHAMRQGVGFERKPFAEFAAAARARGFFHPDQDVLLHFPVPNPMHCLHDVVFSLFAAFVPNSSEAATKPWFAYYLNSKSHGAPCDVDTDWCCFVVDRLRLWTSALHVVPKESSCFRRLWIPRLMHHRFAADWSLAPKGKNIGYLDTRPTAYPLSALRELKRRIVASDAQIVDPPRRPKALRRNVLVLDRADSARRVWANAADFVSLLVQRRGQKFHSFQYFSKGWKNLTPLDQARVFFNADLVIAPHGAQQANGIFLRGLGTLLVEVGCGDAKFERLPDWHVDWTTYARRLGTPTYVYTSLSPKPCQHFMKNFTVDAAGLMGHLDRLLFTNTSSLWDLTGVELVEQGLEQSAGDGMASTQRR
jgi:hypothetical protein